MRADQNGLQTMFNGLSASEDQQRPRRGPKWTMMVIRVLTDFGEVLLGISAYTGKERFWDQMLVESSPESRKNAALGRQRAPSPNPSSSNQRCVHATRSSGTSTMRGNIGPKHLEQQNVDPCELVSRARRR